MRRPAITFLILLPLVILISLPCSIKQDIKQLLSIPVSTSAQIEKNNKVNTCVYTPVQNKKSKQQQLNIKHAFGLSFPHLTVPVDITLYQSTESDPGIFYSVPIFLIYRKLII